MTATMITYSKCQTESNMIESLAAPMIESTRREYEQRLAQKDADIAKRESSLREQEEALSKAKNAIDYQVAEKLQQERERIVAEESSVKRLSMRNGSQ